MKNVKVMVHLHQEGERCSLCMMRGADSELPHWSLTNRDYLNLCREIEISFRSLFEGPIEIVEPNKVRKAIEFLHSMETQDLKMEANLQTLVRKVVENSTKSIEEVYEDLTFSIIHLIWMVRKTKKYPRGTEFKELERIYPKTLCMRVRILSRI